MLTPIEKAWFATYFHGGATDFLNDEMLKAAGGREYSPHERAAALEAVASYRPAGDPVTDPVFAAIGVIDAFSHDARVSKAARSAFRALLKAATGTPSADAYVVRHAMLATEYHRMAKFSNAHTTAADARRAAHTLIEIVDRVRSGEAA